MSRLAALASSLEVSSFMSCFFYYMRKGIFPAQWHYMYATDSLFGLQPQQCLNGDGDALFGETFTGICQSLHHPLRHCHSRDFLIQVPGNGERLQGADTHKNENLIQEVFHVKLFQPWIEAVRIKYQVCLKELRPGIDFFTYTDGLHDRIECKWGCSSAEEELRPVLYLPSIEVNAFIAHPSQYPEHLHRV